MSSHWEKPREYTARAMKGGAGNRTYERIRAGDTSWVVMQLAEESIRSEEAMSGPTPTEVPFVEMQAFLSARGVPVPQIIHFDRELGQIWLEDLGDRQLLDALKAQPPSQWVEGYGPALDLLVAWQQGTASPGDDPPIAYARSFEPQLLRWELDHYREWRVEQQLGRTIDAETLAALGTAFDDLVTRIGAQPQILCHRDFQSTNIMMPPSGPVAIDFQDALMGSWTYDLVALLRDSYVVLTMDQVDALLNQYLDLRPELDGSAFRRGFLEQTVQRKLKDSGRFVYIDRVKNDPGYLQYINDSLGYVRDALERLPHLADLRALLPQLDPEAFE